MPTLTPHSDGAETAADVTPDPPAQARRSPLRRRRLTEYIQAHTGEDIEVALTPHVETACVLPADAERLVDADATDFDQRAARQIVDGVDGDYLVLISTRPAALENLPLSDQLTADRAQQFGLSLHELGHIRYTNISVVNDRLDERVDDEYKDFVHGLINYCEDAAIEHQLREAQSQLAADRLELVNRSLTQMASDIDADQSVTFTYRDAIQSYLYDHGIYDSGKSAVLLDSDDSRITFASDDDATAFEQTQDALDALLATVLSEPDSVARGEAVIDCWHSSIKPLLDSSTEDASVDKAPTATDGNADQRSAQGPSSDSSTSSAAPDVSEDSSDESASTQSGETSTTEHPAPPGGDDNDAQDRSDPAQGDEFEPDNVSLTATQEAASADVLEYPDIGASDAAEELAPDETHSSASGGSSTDSPGGASEAGDSTGQSSSESEEGTESELQDEAVGQSEEAAGSEGGEPDPYTHDSSGQVALTDFQGGQRRDGSTAETGDRVPDEPEAPVDDSPAPAEGLGGDGAPQSDAQPGSPETNRSPTEADDQEHSPENGASVTPDEPGGAEAGGDELPHPTRDEAPDEELDKLDADRAAARDEAAAATPDERALAQDLEETVAALDSIDGSRETEAAETDGQGAGEGALESVMVLPEFGTRAPPDRWRAATAGSDGVAGTLRMALRESRRDQTRSGVTSGSFDRRRVGALARGEVTTFSVRQDGDEKQYDLVLVLDRSGSMGGCIETAEDAVARFSLACEGLSINVAILDFHAGDARLVKPFSVETEHVQASLMSGRTGGGTPLTDALGLARRLLEQRRESPLVIIVTDGKPGDPEAYQAELSACVAPVCGLTLAFDTSRGGSPARAGAVEQYYDRHLYVHDSEQLDDRLDQFAVMFDGL